MPNATLGARTRVAGDIGITPGANHTRMARAAISEKICSRRTGLPFLTSWPDVVPKKPWGK